MLQLSICCVDVKRQKDRSAQRHRSNCLHNLCISKATGIQQYSVTDFHGVWQAQSATDEWERDRIKSDTAGDHFIILI